MNNINFEKNDKELIEASCFNNYDDYEKYLENVIPSNQWFYPPNIIINENVFNEEIHSKK